jgi:formylglycine-generating enzyme required for sulfatase activity
MFAHVGGERRRGAVAAWWRDKAALGGALGIALLAGAFAYRWLRPTEMAPPPLTGVSETEVYQAAAELARSGLETAAAASPTPEATPAASPAASPSPTPTVRSLAELSEEVHAEIDDALARAEAAAKAQRWIDPADDSAVYWYEAALEIDPHNRVARQGLDAVYGQVFGEAHTALDAGDARPATVLLERFADVDTARKSFRELAERVARMPQVEEALRQGAQRLASGRRFEPEGGSALDSYRAAYALDPRSRAAQQGLVEIEQALLTQALAAASEDQFDDSDRLLALAGTTLPGSQAQLETRTRIVELKRQRASGLLARATAALDAQNPDVAEQLLGRAEDLGADPVALAEFRSKLANARLYAHHDPGERFVDTFIDRNGEGPEMVVLPVGDFRMGSPESQRGRRPSEGPVHVVRFERAFALARTETTVAQFRRFVDDTGHVTDAEKAGASSIYDEKAGRITMRRGINWRSDYLGQPAAEQLPVLHVSWSDARAYAQWLAARTGRPYRLPSEAEFEYGLRAGSRARYPWGDGNPTRVLGNYTGDGDRSRTRRAWTRAFPRYDDGHWGPAPAGSFPANAFGLHDLDGNLSEWVDDCWHDTFLRAPEDGTAWVNPGCNRHVVRGGSWGSPPDQIRSAYRSVSGADVRSARLGFRVARTL